MEMLYICYKNFIVLSNLQVYNQCKRKCVKFDVRKHDVPCTVIYTKFTSSYSVKLCKMKVFICRPRQLYKTGSAYQFFPRARLYVVSIWICVLQSVSALGQELGSVEEILPVNPGPTTWHHLVLGTEKRWLFVFPLTEMCPTHCNSVFDSFQCHSL